MAFTVQARVTDFEVIATGEAYEGQAFGTAGRYERIDAVAHFAIDPQSPRARAIVDIDKAAVDEHGEVTFSTQVSILRPMEQDSATLLYDGAGIWRCRFSTSPGPPAGSASMSRATAF